MGHVLNEDIRWIPDAVAPTAAGTTDVNGRTIDMAGFEGVAFCVNFGTLTATQVTKIKMQQGAASDGSDMADLAGTLSGAMGDGDSGKSLATCIIRPSKRYVRCVVDRGTANAVINYGVGVLYGPTLKPVALDANVISQETFVSPAEGTP